jgi:SAM-dependent methyltransferase
MMPFKKLLLGRPWCLLVVIDRVNMSRKSAEFFDAIGIGQIFRPIVRYLREQRANLRIIPWLLTRRRQITTYLHGNACRKLQLGASDKGLPGWLNTDIQLSSPDIVFMDATKPFPVPSQSLDFVFCEHFIEHISLDAAAACLSEVHRCLKIGGIFRVATPNLRRYVDLFSGCLTPEQARFLQLSSAMYGWGRPSPCLALNHLVYNWGHRFLYTREHLADALKDAGFAEIYEVPVGESRYEALFGIEQHGKFYGAEMNKFETMVLEAKK